jgi:Domain of unknown function (DUF4272)
MEIKMIRDNSILVTDSLGVPINSFLPLLDTPVQSRSKDEIFKRLMCLHVVAACAYGLNRAKAKEWVVQEGIAKDLTASEALYLNDGIGDSEQFKARIEGMWALCWALGFISHFDFSKVCDSQFVSLLPNLKILQAASTLKSRVICRQFSEIVQASDIAYCLHWGIRDAELTGKVLPSNIVDYVIIERRRALDWLISNYEWDDISLDT